MPFNNFYGVLALLAVWSTLTMVFGVFAPEDMQPARMEIIVGLAENVFVGALFALLALWFSR